MGRPLTIVFRRESSDEDEKINILQYWKVVWRDSNLRRLPSPRAEIVGIARFAKFFYQTADDKDIGYVLQTRTNWVNLGFFQNQTMKSTCVRRQHHRRIEYSSLKK